MAGKDRIVRIGKLEIGRRRVLHLAGGATIALTGCFQGMLVRNTAESVGLHTTMAVVLSIFLVIVLDAFFAVFFTAIGFV